MAKGVTDTTKFIRAVLVVEIQHSVNQPYLVGTAANLIAFLRTVLAERLGEDWVSRYGIVVPRGWRTAQSKYGEQDWSGSESQASKDAIKYGRKFIRRDLERADCPFKVLIKPDADSGDEDELIMKSPSER